MLEQFDKTFIINLDRRGDRMAEAKVELERVGINDYERVSAVDGRNLQGNFQVAIGHVGCSLSHLNVVRLAKSRNLNNYVVLEDDVVFHPDAPVLFEMYYKDVPTDWDMLFFGGSHVKGFTKVTDHILKMKGTYTTHAMVIRSTMFDKLIHIWNTFHGTAEVDVALARLHKEHNCYSFMPALAWQRAGHSDILERFDDYKHLRYDGTNNTQ
jgi:glycosyl transferase family 25